MACYVSNMLPTSPGSTQSRLDKFARVQVAPSLKHTHTFGCPVFALQSALAAGKSIPKWDARARVGVYLGPSPRNARSVALVLNLSTGLVSPQYHVIFDDFLKPPGSTGQRHHCPQHGRDWLASIMKIDQKGCCQDRHNKATALSGNSSQFGSIR